MAGVPTVVQAGEMRSARIESLRALAAPAAGAPVQPLLETVG